MCGEMRQPRRNVCDQFGDIIPVPVWLQGPTLNPRQVKEIADHHREPVGLFIDRLQELRL